MCENVVFIISVLSLAVSMAAIVVSAVFYQKSSRDLQHITKVITDYLQMAMNNPDIKPVFDKRGRLLHWNITLHPGGINSQEQVSANAKVTEVPKKPD